MPNTMRWRYGETSPVMMTVLEGDVVEIGDLVFLDGGSVKSAASQVDQGAEEANQEFLHDNFVGVAMQSTLGTSEVSIRVATSGVFEFECPLATYEVGVLVGGKEDGTGTSLLSQSVVDVATENLALGRCVKQVPTAASKILVDIVSTVVHGGPQAAA